MRSMKFNLMLLVIVGALTSFGYVEELDFHDSHFSNRNSPGVHRENDISVIFKVRMTHKSALFVYNVRICEL